jgi:hypothetical protein
MAGNSTEANKGNEESIRGGLNPEHPKKVSIVRSHTFNFNDP